MAANRALGSFFSEAGKFSSSQAFASPRKASSSPPPESAMGFPQNLCRSNGITLAPRVAVANRSERGSFDLQTSQNERVPSPLAGEGGPKRGRMRGREKGA